MRQIKFRALCDADDKKQMLYFGMMQFDNGIASWPTPDDVVHIDEYYSPLMQFTGLCDKNGKEIYEGDIVRFTLREYNTLVTVAPNKERIGKVYWQDFRGCWAVQVNPYANQDLFRLINNVDIPAEVIGNIYEAPHLLNQGETPEPSVATED